MKRQRRFDAVANVQLLHDVRHVMFDGSLRAFETSRDLFVRPALRDKREDFLLTRTKITLIIDHDCFDPLALFD